MGGEPDRQRRSGSLAAHDDDGGCADADGAMVGSNEPMTAIMVSAATTTSCRRRMIGVAYDAHVCRLRKM